MLSLYVFFRDMIGVMSGILLGIAAYKQLNPFLRLLVWQAIVYFFTDLIALSFSPNLWLYNIYIPVEFGLLVLAAANCPGLKIRRSLLWLVFAAFLLIFFCELLSINSLFAPLVTSIAISYLLVTLLYIYLIYVVANSQGDRLSVFGVIIPAIGVVCYCAGSIPCIAALTGLYPNPANFIVIKEVYQNTVVLLGQLRYCLFAVGCGLFVWRTFSHLAVKR